MATVTHLVTTPDTGNTPNTSGAFSPASGDLLVVIVTKEASALSSPMASADLTSSVAPTAFTLIRNQGHQSSAAHVGVFVANALTTNTTSRTVTIASGTDAGAGTIISVYAVSGMTKVGSDAIRGQGGQTDQAAGTPAPAFGAAALTTNPCIGAIYNATNPAGLTQPSGWSEGSDTGYTTGQVSGIETAFRNSGETGTTITWGSSSASAFASLILELDQSNPITVTPGIATLTTTTFAPTVTVTNHQLVTPGAAALALTTFAPTVRVNTNLVPGVASLTLTLFAPTVTATQHQLVTPGLATLSITAFAPTVTTTNHQIVVPGVATLTVTRFAPTVTATAHQLAIPGTATLTVTLFAPTVTASNHITVIPGTTALTLATFAPTVTVGMPSNPVLVTPGLATLTLTRYAPTVIVVLGYPGYPYQAPKVTYTGPPPPVTASRTSPYLIGTAYKITHRSGRR